MNETNRSPGTCREGLSPDGVIGFEAAGADTRSSSRAVQDEEANAIRSSAGNTLG